MSRLAADVLVSVLERLPTGVVVVDEAATVRYTNVAARRLLHPLVLRVGGRLPETPGWDKSLLQLCSRLFELGLLPEQAVSTGDRSLQIGGVIDRRKGLGTLLLGDVSARAQRVRSEEDFAVNVAHEILSPIAAIAGAAQVLRDGAKDDPVARDRFIGHIASAADRLTSTATALLVLARSESGLGGPRLELIPLRPVLDGVQRGRDEVRVNCAPDVAVLADVDLLRQALVILVENARRHAPGDVGITVDHNGEMVAVDVVDQGAGILPENLERVTERFVSAGGDESRGYGVGLSIAARAAKVMGGTLELASDRSGTRARLQLPSARLL